MIINSVRQTIKRENLIEKNDKILIALSGGPDSICLLDIMIKLKDEYNLTLYAAHLNHRIRGIDAQEDSLFCQKICKKNNVTFFVKNIDIPELAVQQSRGVEEVARDVRYDMFFDIKNKLGINKIAVAHNLDDQAETMLMKMFRGSGIQGLRGIDYKRKDGIIRPLLDIYKSQINEYCDVNNLNPRIDKTNFESDYSRNKVRLDLIPYIENNYCENIKQILSRTANVIRDDYNYIEEVSKEHYELLVKNKSDDEIILDLPLLKNTDTAIQKRVIRLAILDIIGNLNNIENVHIVDSLSLLEKSDGKIINLPKNLKAYIKNEDYVITTKNQENEEITYEYNIEINGKTVVNEIGLTVTTSVLPAKDSLALPVSKYIKVFDYDKIVGSLYVRSRKIGDKLSPIGLTGTKKIKDILINKKIPADTKYMFPIISDDEQILWLLGYRISENYKIDDSTQRVIRIQLEYDDDRRNIVEKFI
ncbi:MAG: tRNA lysidine(34) synthetase TilS [Peptostreptococcaceae bacterium]|nr:tRNA lysidine(34) synthetase TilS [Peptostreptococcaceae bacterium]